MTWIYLIPPALLCGAVIAICWHEASDTIDQITHDDHPSSDERWPS